MNQLMNGSKEDFQKERNQNNRTLSILFLIYHSSWLLLKCFNIETSTIVPEDLVNSFKPIHNLYYRDFWIQLQMIKNKKLTCELFFKKIVELVWINENHLDCESILYNNEYY